MNNKVVYIFTAALSLSIGACNNDYMPKPRGYFKIKLPDKKYQLFNRSDFPYSFEYPIYGNIVQDSLFFDQKAENPYWINIELGQFNAKIYLSYKQVGKPYKLDSLISDAFTMSYKQHTYKATSITKEQFINPGGTGGIYFTLKGNTATANQFFVTDSVKHFLRGALYFNVTPNEDSLAPVNSFLRADLKHLINTIRWK